MFHRGPETAKPHAKGPGLQISFPSRVTLLKRNPKHTENLKDHRKEPDKDIFTLFPKARKENIFSPESLI